MTPELALILAFAGVAAWLAVLFTHRRRRSLVFPVVALVVFTAGSIPIALLNMGTLRGFPFTVQDIQIFARTWLVASGVAYLLMLRRHR